MAWRQQSSVLGKAVGDRRSGAAAVLRAVGVAMLPKAMPGARSLLL